jgi:DNA repair protein RecO (recombination protein O)
MPVFSAESLVLRTYRYGEADRIVVFLTADRGKKRGVAKHASKSRKRFGGALEPLTQGRATYVEREGRDLVRLDRIEPRETPLGAVAGLDAGDAARTLGYASYFAELIDEWAPDDAPNERVFRLGMAVAAAIGRGPSVEGLARYFEYWLLKLEGVYPAIDRCPRCGQGLNAGAALSVADRAYVCRTCQAGAGRLSAGAMAFLGSLRGRTPLDVVAGHASGETLVELERVHERLIAMHLEKTLRSVRVVKELGTHL